MANQEQSLVFVSYRRQDSSAASHWLGETLQAAFGSSSVFIDTDAIRIGDAWPERINSALRAASVLLAIIGPNWLRLSDEYGRRRLDIDDDWVRNELLHAVNNKVLLIPLLVSGASLPVKEALPDCLLPMLNYQAFELRDDQWERDRNVLLERLVQVGFRRTSLGRLPTGNVEELNRREALVFNQQLEILKTALSLVYRARNAARTLKETPDSETRGRLRGPLRNLHSYHEAFENLLFEERALLPDRLFSILHDLKNHLAHLSMLVEHSRRFQERGRDQARTHLVKEIERSYLILDQGYEVLVGAVQSYIGVKGDTA